MGLNSFDNWLFYYDIELFHCDIELFHFDNELFHFDIELFHFDNGLFHYDIELFHFDKELFHYDIELFHFDKRHDMIDINGNIKQCHNKLIQCLNSISCSVGVLTQIKLRLSDNYIQGFIDVSVATELLATRAHLRR